MRTISICDSRTMRSEEDSVFGASGEVRYAVCGLRAQNDGAEIMVRLSAECEGKRETKTVVLTTEQYLELHPARGEISEEAYAQLCAAAELCAAIRAGESLLSFAANSVQMLAKKLMGKGYSRSTALAAAQILASRGMIDEERDLRREVERAQKKLWGPKRISAHLWSRGFGKEAMEKLPEILDGVDFVAVCRELIAKHYVRLPEDEGERRRMIAFLSRYGYSIGDIRRALALSFDGESEE